jgi:hypothetical protein
LAETCLPPSHAVSKTVEFSPAKITVGFGAPHDGTRTFRRQAYLVAVERIHMIIAV